MSIESVSATVKVYFFKGGKILKKIAFQPGQHIVVTIGKEGQQVDIGLPSNLVSRQHGQLIFSTAGELYYVDLGSTNGSFYKTKRLASNEKVKLNFGDKLSFTEDHQIYMAVLHPNEKVQMMAEVGKPTGDLKQTDLIDKFSSKNTITIGRSNDCDVVLNSASISRQHCQIERLSDGTYLIRDLNSMNGTYVNGRKLRGSQKITEKDQIIVGRFVLSLRGQARNLGDETAIRAAGIMKRFENGTIGLSETTISIPNKSLLAIMGPSGCGKSTLLKALNGEAPPTVGEVYLFEQELISNYEYLKTQIGYVPQDDIVHKQLTVEQSLYYAAKLRLDNPSQHLIEEKIDQILTDLNISHIRNSMVSKISGGQRKRVSIGVELLTDPLILFLDEPTSPLDPQTIEEFLGILKNLADRGTTIVMVTHKPEDLTYMDQVIFMAEGGHLVYYGSTKNYQSYFNVHNPVKVYVEITGPNKKKWIDKFKTEHPSQGSMGNTNQDIRQSSRVNIFDQWRWLTARYLTIKTNDRVNTVVLLAQAPIIAALMCLVFSEVTLAVPFLMAISAVWFGVNNAAREIVSEMPVYMRERMFNLKLFPYIMSKMAVLTIFSAIQSLMFVGIITVVNQGNDPNWNDPLGAFLWMVFLSATATLLGLVLSALVNSTEKVMTLVPIVLIPQILLGGFITKIGNSAVEIISYFMLSRWGTEGFTIQQGTVMAPPPSTYRMDGVSTLHNNYYKYNEWFGDSAGQFETDFVAVAIWSLIYFGLIWLALKKKDSIPRGRENR